MARMMVMVCDCCGLREEVELDYETPPPWMTVLMRTPSGNVVDDEVACLYACGRECALKLLSGLSLRTESSQWRSLTVSVMKKKESFECP